MCQRGALNANFASLRFELHISLRNVAADIHRLHMHITWAFPAQILLFFEDRYKALVLR